MRGIDANDVARGSVLETDICIIGSGAASFTIARQLIDQGMKVLILESGRYDYDQATQDLYEFENVGHPLRAQKGYISRNRYLGGSTNTWLGRAAPMQSEDFEARPWVPNSGWPIPESEVARFYPEAARTLRVPDADYLTNNAWRRYLLGDSDDFLTDGQLEPTIFLLGKTPINMKKAYLKEVQASQNIQVVTGANVTELVPDAEHSALQHVEVRTLGGNAFRVRGRSYVLACGGWENVRLLLASRSVDPAGVGNRHDNVGRFYQEHPKILGSKLYLNTKTLKSPIVFWKRKISKEGHVRLAIKISRDLQEKYELTNNNFEVMYPQTMADAIAYSETLFNNMGFSRSTIHNFVKLAPYVFSLAESFERLLFNLPLRFEFGTLISHMEQVPDRGSRIMLGDDVDALGMPRLRVNLQISVEDKERMKLFHRVLSEQFEQRGWGRLESELPPADEPWPALTDSSHHIGTTRMSDRPEDGVVDPDCRVHGVGNLFVAGSSVFPTGGHVNPTFMIVALSLRLAEHLKREYQS